MALKLTPEQQAVDAQLRAVNRKLTSIAKAFGLQSEQYRYLEALVTQAYVRPEQTRKNAAGVTQISRTKKQVILSGMDMEQKVIGKILKTPSVKEHKQRILESWAKEEAAKRNALQHDYDEEDDEEYVEYTAEMVMQELTQRERKDIIQQRTEYYQALQDALETALDKLYDRSKRKTRAQYRALQRVKEISKGHWTTTKELTEMLQTLTDTMGREGKKIWNDYMKKAGGA